MQRNITVVRQTVGSLGDSLGRTFERVRGGMRRRLPGTEPEEDTESSRAREAWSHLRAMPRRGIRRLR